MGSKLIFGVGVNDAGYTLEKVVNGKRVICPYYSRWRDMLKRCYSKKYLKSKPSYNGCAVCEEWLTFSNFKAWMETQDWQGKELDKDLLVKGNKLYSAETCVFLHPLINGFLRDSVKSEGGLMSGVCWHKGAGKFMAQCCDAENGKRVYLGLFDSEIEAHEAWKRKKRELACIVALSQKDVRVSNSLNSRYL